MADLLRPKLAPLHTHHSRNVSTNTVDSDSSDSSPNPLDEDTDFMMHMNDSSSTIGALTAIQDCEMDVDMDHIHRVSPIQKLPPELLIHIFSKLTTTGDLRSCMLVCYHWALFTVGILWHRPLCSKMPNLLNVCRTLSDAHPSFAYHDMVKRLNLSAIADKVNDGTVQAFFKCKGVERLTLTSCSNLTDLGVEGLVNGSKRLQALDVTDLDSISDRSMHRVAQNCPKLQGLNITNCSFITDDSLSKIAINCIQLKRLKLNGVTRATDQSIVAVAENCRSILEIDLAGCQNISSASVTALLTNLPHLRELRLAHCIGIDSHAFTDLKAGLRFDALRILDITACDGVGDDAIARLIPAAPRLRNLVLAKCRHITDLAVKAICTLTKNLHYIHLGHCQLLTDNAVIELVQQCNRIRYIDLACCSRLTDASVRHLAKLPKLRRVGLVKCQNLTDASIIALARGPYGSGSTKPGMPTQFVSLERVHLSYCTSLTLRGITQLLLNCPRLTHLSLTGVQAFLRDDLTRFCREAPTEFTHVQRDVFCVFSGDGVIRLRDYLARLALEQQERDQEQQSALDEPVLGPDSPDADSLSDGTIDGNEQNMQLDMVFGPGRHGIARLSEFARGVQVRPRPRSFNDLPHPNFHIEMPLLPSDQMQRMGPWTPGHVTPDFRPPPIIPQQLLPGHQPGFAHFASEYMSQRTPSPVPTPALLVPDSQPRSRSQSRRHTLDATNALFASNYGYPDQPASSSRAPDFDHEFFNTEHVGLPTFQPAFQASGASTMPLRSEPTQRTSGLRPDHAVSSFEVNHDAILSTIPGSRGSSRRPSPAQTPHLSRATSRSRIGNYFGEARGVSNAFHNDAIGGRSTPNPRSREASRRGPRPDGSIASGSTYNAEEQLRHEIYGEPSSSSSRRSRHPSILPPGLMDHVLMTPDTPVDSPGPSTHTPTRNERRRNMPSGDIDMTQ